MPAFLGCGDARSLAQSLCAPKGLSKLSGIIGIFFDARVAEKYVIRIVFGLGSAKLPQN